MTARKGRCPKCDGRMGRAPLAGSVRTETTRLVEFDRASSRGSIFGSRVIHMADVVVCIECGFFEEYVRDARRINWRDIEGFELLEVDPEPEGPFR